MSHHLLAGTMIQRALVRRETTAAESALTDLSAGRPLEADVHSDLEQGFRVPLGSVRVHTDANAARLAAGLGAHAFTRGSDIYFAAGLARFNTALGRRLLAHEVAHTVQNRASGNAAAALVSQPGAAAELSAERAASAVLAGQQPPAPIGTNGALLARQATQSLAQLPGTVIPELPNEVAIIVTALLERGKRQAAIDQLVLAAKQLGRIDTALLEGGSMTYTPSLSDEGSTPDPLPKRGGGFELCKPEIGTGAFTSGMGWLYSTILHEYDHVKKLQNPANRGVANKMSLEVDAYGMEIDNARLTGVAVSPTDVAILWDRLVRAYNGLFPVAKRAKQPEVERLYKVALQLVAKDPKIKLQAP